MYVNKLRQLPNLSLTATQFRRHRTLKSPGHCVRSKLQLTAEHGKIGEILSKLILRKERTLTLHTFLLNLVFHVSGSCRSGAFSIRFKVQLNLSCGGYRNEHSLICTNNSRHRLISCILSGGCHRELFRTILWTCALTTSGRIMLLNRGTAVWKGSVAHHHLQDLKESTGRAGECREWSPDAHCGTAHQTTSGKRRKKRAIQGLGYGRGGVWREKLERLTTYSSKHKIVISPAPLLFIFNIGPLGFKLCGIVSSSSEMNNGSRAGILRISCETIDSVNCPKPSGNLADWLKWRVISQRGWH